MMVLVLVIACLLHIVIQTTLIWYAYKDVPSDIVRDDISELEPQQPTVLTITGGLMDKYTYKIGLPELGADDVVSREMHVMIDGVESMYVIADVSMKSYDLVLNEGSDCIIWMVDIDDAGNRSKKGERLIFQVIDIVPPAAPSAPIVSDVVLYNPVMEEPVVEEPVMEEPVVEEPVMEEPVVEEPVMEEPVVEEPVMEEPVMEEPVMEEPVMEEPVVVEEVIEENPPQA